MRFLNLKLGDIESVDPRSAKMQALRGYPGFDFGAGTLKVSRFRDREMPPKTPEPQARQASGEAGEDSLGYSSIVASRIDGNQCHKEICEALIPKTTGWENLFLREIAKLTKVGVIQWGKIREIAERCEREKDNTRLCHHCGKKARIIDQFSYFCPQCGNCLQLYFGGER